MPKSRIRIEGPLFDGRGAAAARDYCDAVAREVASVAADWIRIAAHDMDKSGRGGTGAAAEAVRLFPRRRSWVVRGGIATGHYDWPWLEGTSKRNESTAFRGYHTFRKTRLKARREAGVRAQELMDTFVTALGGE